jgi:hypothetical protein
MRDEMIKRVALAIEKSYEGRHWDTEAMAAAAIEAMREPTPPMRLVGADIAGNSEDGAAIIWRSMINAALGKVDA